MKKFKTKDNVNKTINEYDYDTDDTIADKKAIIQATEDEINGSKNDNKYKRPEREDYKTISNSNSNKEEKS